MQGKLLSATKLKFTPHLSSRQHPNNYTNTLVLRLCHALSLGIGTVHHGSFFADHGAA